ncbi:dihydroxyacetone kinase phosphoryl donor subunit DhaM [Catenulispora subtropica]|uniref:phosphoenolpyruvate--glycerone phosphotransferase n=1 Tax=Catenulispora subtropica TaxID=450798 RepID=A0ABP5EST7_9ACTN
MGPLVGIVLVSHSARLAEGLREMLAQTGASRVPVAVAGGTADGGIGTNYDLVASAIGAAAGAAGEGAGAVVLADLGSSVLTTRAVLEDHPRADVLLVDAPFVEGAVAAAAAAAGGANLEAVAAAARAARGLPKIDTAAPEAAESEPVRRADGRPGCSAQVTLRVPLHLRPARRLAQEAARFTSDIRLGYRGKAADCASVLSVIGLGAEAGATVVLRAEGRDARAAVDAMKAVLLGSE